MVSIFDVARRAGVSSTTVSHTINGHRYVSPQLQERVRQAMTDLNYVPSRTAQNLARGQNMILGCLVPDIGNSFFAELAKGVEQAAIDLRYNVLVGNTGFDRERELLYLSTIRSRAVDGLIYAAGFSDGAGTEQEEFIRSLPLVLVDEEIVGFDAVSVVSDNESGGALAAEHLLALGHRSALVIAAADGLMSSTRRVNGFERAWRAGGGGRLEATFLGFTDEDGRQAVAAHADALLAGEFTAIFAGNDLMAMGAIHQLRMLGLDVPRDLSVVGFDDIAVARYFYPALTTVRQDVSGMGAMASRILITALSSKQPLVPRRELIPVEFVVRDSTAPPPTGSGS